eukprot:6485099-Amphidinium_carterae.2
MSFVAPPHEVGTNTVSRFARCRGEHTLIERSILLKAWRGAHTPQLLTRGVHRCRITANEHPDQVATLCESWQFAAMLIQVSMELRAAL